MGKSIFSIKKQFFRHENKGILGGLSIRFKEFKKETQ
jgi:hypothetical protein